MDDTDPTAIYNTSELYALRILHACADELSTGVPASQAVLAAINELLDRHGRDGVNALIAALGRMATVALDQRARATGTSLSLLLQDWEEHKLAQHADDDGEDDGSY